MSLFYIEKCNSVSYCDSVRETLETQLLKQIDRKRGDVFLRADFDDFGGYDQVGRVLRLLVRRGKLMKVGFGLYSRAIRYNGINLSFERAGPSTRDAPRRAVQVCGV